MRGKSAIRASVPMRGNHRERYLRYAGLSYANKRQYALSGETFTDGSSVAGKCRTTDMSNFSILVSSNERKSVMDALGDMAIEANLGFDFQLFTRQGVVAVERKKFPNDFIASVDDSRLAKECAAMREEGDFRFVIVEGKGRYSGNRLMLGRKPSRWTRAGIRNLMRSIRYVEDADVEYTSNIKDTVSRLVELQEYFDKEDHLSLRVRAGCKSNIHFTPTYEERLLHFYQGLPSVSIIRARELAKIYPCSVDLHKASLEDLLKVPGIGKQTAEAIYVFINEGRLR